MRDHEHAPNHACCSDRKPGHLACPRCGAMGQPVPKPTVARFVSPEVLASLGEGEPRFCPHPACEVAYYAPLGRPITRDQLSVGLGVKDGGEAHPICHCFGHSRGSLAAEWAEKHSVSAVMEVMAKVRAGECQCETLNPKGVCCLPDLRRAVLALQEMPLAPEPEPSDACASCADADSCADNGCCGCGG